LKFLKPDFPPFQLKSKGTEQGIKAPIEVLKPDFPPVQLKSRNRYSKFGSKTLTLTHKTYDV